MVWELRGNENQNRIVQQALDRTRFPFDDLRPGLQAAVGRSVIPVEWGDLSRYNLIPDETEHLHVHMNGDTGHPITRDIDGRHRVLGLAWYSGRVTLDNSLEFDDELAMEVFLSEGAHMIDFFWMTPEHREAIWNALHADHEDAEHVPDTGEVDHGHSWFDVGGYYSWVGEAWMGLFVRAYSDLPVTIDFDHPPTDAAVAEARAALTPYFQTKSGKVHDKHRGQVPVRYLATIPEGASRCGVCKPA